MKQGKRVRISFSMNSKGLSLQGNSVKAMKREKIGFQKPSLSTIKVASSISGAEKRFRTILEKKAQYKKPVYMA